MPIPAGRGGRDDGCLADGDLGQGGAWCGDDALEQDHHQNTRHQQDGGTNPE
jgi:hypothetical protein